MQKDTEWNGDEDSKLGGEGGRQTRSRENRMERTDVPKNGSVVGLRRRAYEWEGMHGECVACADYVLSQQWAFVAL